MKTVRWIKGLARLACAVCIATGVRAAEVRVFAAASLQGPLDTIAADWSADVVISYGGSGTIARQISLGAPADLVLLANSAWAGWLVDQGHAPGPTRDLIGNRLVLIGPPDRPALTHVDAANLLKELKGGRLAMGQHRSVPAGIYGRAWLDHIGAWEALRPHLAETENVRAALALVARGEAPLGLVYASDAAASAAVAANAAGADSAPVADSAAVSTLWIVPADSHPPIRYPGLALTPDGAAFLDHLLTRTDVFVAAGFTALP